MQAPSDRDIAAAVRRALEADPLLPRHAVRVTVSSGWIVLVGEVPRALQRWAAEADVRRLPGVVGIENRIVVRG